MAVYVDHVRIPFKGMLMSHMTADSLLEIHDMATRLGLQHKWFQCPPKVRFPHYDIPETRRKQALSLGAQPVCSRTTLHYAARLGIEWVDAQYGTSKHEVLIATYQRTLTRTEKFLSRRT